MWCVHTNLLAVWNVLRWFTVFLMFRLVGRVNDVPMSWLFLLLMCSAAMGCLLVFAVSDVVYVLLNWSSTT